MEYEGNKALVKADLEDRKIFISVTGRVNGRRGFLSTIRSHFESIHATIAKLEAVGKVPLPSNPNVVVDYQHLLRLEESGIRTIVPENAGEVIELGVAELLNGIEARDLRETRRIDDQTQRSDIKKITAEDDDMKTKDKPKVEINHNNNPWKSGSFYLFAAIVMVILVAVLICYVPWYAAPLVIIGGILLYSIVGAAQLRNDNLLSEKGFLSLMLESFKRLPLLNITTKKRDD